MATKKEVSIIIPAYNMAWCLPRAIKSCLKQTVKPSEIIIVDDGSTDKTKSVMQKLCLEYPHIEYLSLTKNRGAAVAMMTGVKAAKSRWVAFLDADDELTNDSLALRLAAVANYASPAKLGFVYGDVYVKHGDNLKLIKNKYLSGYQYPYLTQELSLCQQIVMLVDRVKLLKSGYPTATLSYATDDDMLMTLAKESEITYTQNPVAIIHLHQSKSRMSNNLDRVAEGTASLIQKYRKDIIHYHGYGRLFLWHLRLFRRRVEAEKTREHNILYSWILKVLYAALQFFVTKTFDIHWL